MEDGKKRRGETDVCIDREEGKERGEKGCSYLQCNIEVREKQP